MKGTRTMKAPIGFAAALLVLGLSGCISFGAKPPPTLFGLTPASSAPAGPLPGGSLRQALVVQEPEVDKRLAVIRVPVQIDESNVAYLKDAQWVSRPARLFRSLLAETIRAKGTRLVLEDDAVEAGGATHLAGRLLDMGYDARTRAAVVRYDAIRQVGNGPVASQRFEASVPVAEAKAAYVGPALNQAANQVARQVADWVG
jgi:cholesterol transport system auxiliary component